VYVPQLLKVCDGFANELLETPSPKYQLLKREVSAELAEIN
jgi:hypothetical protein